MRPLGVNCSLGIEDRNLASLASTPTNSCRQLHRFVARTGKRLPVKISYVKTFIKKITKSRVHEVEVDFPTLHLSAWMEASFRPWRAFLSWRKGIDHFQSFSKILHDWWVSYRKIDPTLPFFQDFDESHYGCSFPIGIHGDEGRGRYKPAHNDFQLSTIDPQTSMATPTSKGPVCLKQLKYCFGTPFLNLFWLACIDLEHIHIVDGIPRGEPWACHNLQGQRIAPASCTVLCLHPWTPRMTKPSMG